MDFLKEFWPLLTLLTGGGGLFALWHFKLKGKKYESDLNRGVFKNKVESNTEYLEFMDKATETINRLHESNWKKEHDKKSAQNDLVALLDMASEHIGACQMPEKHFKEFIEICYNKYASKRENGIGNKM